MPIQPTADASVPVSPDASGSEDAGAPVEDAALAPRSAACVPSSQQTGTLANTDHGRLDGTLVYVIAPGLDPKCNGDSSHVHLQIEVQSLVYDVAVDIGQSGDEVGMLQQTMTVPGGTWSEGWHGTDTLAYPSLSLKSTAMPLQAPATIGSDVMAALETTSKVSIFCTSYSQGNGCHDVHYENGNGEDGAIVLDPTSATSPILFFRFEDQSF